MTANTPVIQVLSRNSYVDQHLVPLPTAYPLPPLSPSSLRIKPTILSLTTNNLTYARVGHMLGWWDIHPLPPSIPEKYSDPKSFGRISAWGYGVVIESNVSSIEIGTQVYGYLPIGTLPIDMAVEINEKVTGQFREVSKHRAHVLPIYNRYYIHPLYKTEGEIVQSLESQGQDSLLFPLFGTGYAVNRFLFPPDSTELVYPSGSSDDGWNLQKATVDQNSILLLFSASGKTALSLAYNLKHQRPSEKTPRMIVGIGSEASKDFAEGTGLYDKVMTYDADSSDFLTAFGLREDSKIVICDFGARESAADRWAAKLLQSHKDVVQLGIGGEVVAVTPEMATENFMSRMMAAGNSKPTINASAVMSQAMDVVGEQRYWDEFWNAFEAFKKQGAVTGLKLVWGDGMNDLGRAWERLCSGEVGPEEGLVFTLDGKSVEKL